jgi:hypothetical protein
MKQSIQISKLDAAKRQLETAIQIYFAHGDPVSLHTLCAAAYNIIRDVASKRGGLQPMLVKDQLIQLAKPDGRKPFRDKLNEAENFFKHADRDHDGVHDFSPALSELFLLDASTHYYQLTSESPPLFKVYRAWFIANNPDFFNFAEADASRIHRSAPEIAAMGRGAFLQEMLPLAVTMRI